MLLSLSYFETQQANQYYRLVTGNPITKTSHRRECPVITYMAMGFRPRSFPVGEMYVKGIGRLTKVKKNHSLLFSIAS